MVIRLPDGYHKSGVVWCGRTAVVACFDSGSHRNILSGEMLTRLLDEPRAVTACDGFVRGSSAVYDHVAIFRVSFRDEGTREHSQQLLFVVAPDAAMPMIAAMPMTTWTNEVIDLTAVRLRFPTVLPPDPRRGAGDRVNEIRIRDRAAGHERALDPVERTTGEVRVRAGRRGVRADGAGVNYPRSCAWRRGRCAWR